MGTNAIFLGFDIGTTVLKAAVIEGGTGRALVHAAQKLDVQLTADGGREQAPQELLAAMARLAGKLRRELGRRWDEVAGIGVAAQGGSAILMNPQTGRPATTMQLWSDTRPLQLLAGIAARKPQSYWPRLSWLDGPGAGLARIAWLRKWRPQLFRRAFVYGGAGEYAYFHLTGQWRQDAGNALQIGCYDVQRQAIAAEPLRLVGLRPSNVAPMRRGHEPHPLSAGGAKLLHLPAGVPVVGPYIDHEAGYLSACGLSRRPMQCSLGTAWVANYVQPRGTRPPPGLNLVLPSPVAQGTGSKGTGSRCGFLSATRACPRRDLPNRTAGTGTFSANDAEKEPVPFEMVIRVMVAGNATWDWAVNSFAGGRDALAASASIFRKRLLPPRWLVALPWITRPNPLDAATAGAGGFLGISAATHPHDLLRAMAAAMAFEFVRTVRPSIEAGRPDSVVLTGGAANAECFRALLAALLRPLPVLHLEDDFMGARGAVWAFDPAVVARRAAQVSPPSARECREIDEAFALYLRATDLLRDAGLLPA